MDRSLIHPSISEVQYLICSLSFSLTPMDQCKFLFISQNKDHAISRNHLLQTAQAFAFPRMVDVDFCSSSSKLVINWKLLRFPVPKWVKNTKQDLLNIFFSVIKRKKKFSSRVADTIHSWIHFCLFFPVTGECYLVLAPQCMFLHSLGTESAAKGELHHGLELGRKFRYVSKYHCQM